MAKRKTTQRSFKNTALTKEDVAVIVLYTNRDAPPHDAVQHWSYYCDHAQADEEFKIIRHNDPNTVEVGRFDVDVWEGSYYTLKPKGSE